LRKTGVPTMRSFCKFSPITNDPNYDDELHPIPTGMVFAAVQHQGN
jgi:hypothetical protein